MVQEMLIVLRGCHSHSFCTMICDRGQNESQRSAQNICHNQRSSHLLYLFNICGKIGQGQGKM